MKFVKKKVVKKSNRPENNRLKYLLHKSIAKWVPQRSIDVLHASDMTKKEFCPARVALMKKNKVKPSNEFISTSMRVTFDYGRYLEESVVGYLGDSVIGDWECHAGHKSSLVKRPEECQYDYEDGTKILCEAGPRKYLEPRWVDKETDISCGTDFFVDLGEGKPILIELKSLKAPDFKTISRPRKEHLLRTNLYLHILKRSGILEVNVDEAIVLYTCKGYGFADEFIANSDLSDTPFSPFKEFTVKREDNEEIDRIFSDGLSIKNYLEKGGPLPRKVCDTKHCTQAKSCEVREVCFA